MDEKMMRRALNLARKGAGFTNPNPMVGAVIVKDGRVIGEGWHEAYGGPHAEIIAFEKATEDVAGATMYVTLEPCSHYGKTPPCVHAIVEKKLARVVVAMEDPNPLVAGRGIEFLKRNGIQVDCGILEQEAMKLNNVFVKFITTGRPYCVMKTAMTLDGKIASYTGSSKWITNEESRAFVHRLRSRMTGIMVGITTVLVDDPMLTSRLQERTVRQPVRIVLDSRARIPLSSAVLKTTHLAETIVVVTELADPGKVLKIQEMGAEVVTMPIKNGHVDIDAVMEHFGKRGIDSILLEAGGAINYSALADGVVDKVYAFIAPKIIGGKSAKTPVEGEGIAEMQDAIQLEDLEIVRFGDDVMIGGYICSRD